MAFSKLTLDPTGSGSRGVAVMGVYETTDTKATVKGAGYFNTAANELTRVRMLLLVCSDAVFFAKCSVAAGVVTIAAPDVYA